MAFYLPSFSSLLAFDAAARHVTFTRAARALNVTQPAVSRRVAALEADLGVLLFNRSTKPMQLTDEGLELFDVLRSGLSRLEAVIADLRSRGGNRKFTIAASPGFLSYWLLPRFNELRDAFPDLELSFMTGDYGAPMAACDVQIQFGDGCWEGMISEKVLGEVVFPVCSPAYLNDNDDPFTIDGLHAARLLQLSDSYKRWYDWKSWLHTANLTVCQRPKTIDFDSYATLINAALAGQGVALCWSGLLDEYLEAGALVRMSEHTLTSDRGYFVSYSDRHDADSFAAEFSNWVVNQGNQT